LGMICDWDSKWEVNLCVTVSRKGLVYVLFNRVAKCTVTIGCSW